jgi:hypothetical protein
MSRSPTPPPSAPLFLTSTLVKNHHPSHMHLALEQ